MPIGDTSGQGVVFTAGPRDAERVLFERLREVLPVGGGVPEAPVRIVVPSRSLRRHLLAAIARRLGPVVGLVVETHRTLALEVLDRAGVRLPEGGAAVQDLLVRERASQIPELDQSLGGFEDGFGPVAGAVRDLLDAGMGVEHIDPLLEAIDGADGAGRDRARAVVRVAAEVAATVETLGLAHRGTIFREARRVLAAEGPSLLSGARVLIYGFAEATGLLSDLIETLVRSCGAELFVDHPPDPARPGRVDPGREFTRRLVERVSRFPDREIAGNAESPQIAAFRAPGEDAEIREIAGRCLALHDVGTPWERIGVVRRSLPPATVRAIRRHFGRLGIPFSGEGTTVPGGGAARRGRAVAALLRRGAEAVPGVWLEARSREAGRGERKFELAMRTMGLTRLSRVGTGDAIAPTDAINLPVVERIENAGGRIRPIRPRISPEEWTAFRDEARSLIDVLAERPHRAAVGEFLEWIGRVLETLGPVGPDDSLRTALSVFEEIPADLEVDWAALEPLVLRALEDIDAEPIGGAGGGVQVLTVMEARGRVFDSLFLCGLNRGVFPARVGEDPVFESGLRRAAAGQLFDLPIRDRDRPEERYLFAQLMASSPSITLSWQEVDSEGAARNPSVFIDRMRLAGVLPHIGDEDVAAPEIIPDWFGPRPEAPPLEAAVAAALVGDRGPVFLTAIGRLGGPDTAHLEAVLDEQDPPHFRDDLGPFLGPVGLPLKTRYPVTRLEAVVRCPWRVFLERELFLEPPPEGLFGDLDRAIVGSIVHSVLETIAERAGVPSNSGVDEIVRGVPVDVVWPGPGEVSEIVRRAARRETVRRGVPRLAPLLARAAAPLIERARRLAWPGDRAMILGVEARGEREILGAGIVVEFRADRVEREGNTLVFVDYKTGNKGSAPKTVIPRGELLQGAVYALGDENRVGRYLYLGSDLSEKAARVEVAGSLANPAIDVIEILVGAMGEAVAFPRLCTPGNAGDGPSCRYCTLKAACFFGDSGVRRRLAAAFDVMDEERFARKLWFLPDAGKKKR